MKPIGLIAYSALAIFLISCTQPRTYLLKTNTDGVKHRVFIEYNRQSRFYREISRFDFDEYDKTSFANSLEYLKENGLSLQPVGIDKSLPRKWINFRQYQGKYYAYYPSDFYCHWMAGITDSAYVEYACEGPEANQIVSYLNPDPKTHRFNLKGVSLASRMLTIHLIDTDNGIAVFEETSPGREKHFRLMIDAAKIRRYPIIVNFCRYQKQPEFELEEPDYMRLLLKK